jgi:hypothetical protein
MPSAEYLLIGMSRLYTLVLRAGVVELCQTGAVVGEIKQASIAVCHSRISARLVDSCDLRISASIFTESYFTCAISHALLALLFAAL